MEDWSKAHADLHWRCGSGEGGCACAWCQEGKCKEKGKQLLSSYYRVQVSWTLWNHQLRHLLFAVCSLPFTIYHLYRV